MARVIDMAAGVMVLVAAGALYAVKHDTRQLEQQVQARERAAEKAEADIAVLKAEKAYLARPERIEQLARKQGLEPIREHQYSRIEEPAEDAIARLLERPIAASDRDAEPEPPTESLPTDRTPEQP
ncbi:MAG: cell division protein FtsL [Hyphomicrobiaceae bacterium]